MPSSFRFSAGGDYSLQTRGEDGERVFCRGWRIGLDGNQKAVLAVLLGGQHATPLNLGRLANEYALKDELDDAWAARPLELVREDSRTMLVLNDPGGEPLERIIGTPLDVGSFLRLAISIVTALGNVHQRGLVHRDVKPPNILVDSTTSAVWLTGFGIASRLPRERRPAGPPNVIAGTLAYMSPEQTGRMNRSIDSRSDLYACGVTLYEMLTGTLPFSGGDPMEWIHCHIARQATPPSDREKEIPTQLSAIVMKLLAKTPEERYQTAAGVAADLLRCQAEWQAHGRIEPFPLAMRDASDRLMIPEALYGREREINRLLGAFDRVVASGTTELFLVSGYSGIGKSSVVNEIHKALVPPRGLFASGKFDQYKRDIPYTTLAQAFQSLVRRLLGQSEVELGRWRDALRESLGQNGQLIVQLVPELELVIGKQPPVPDLMPQDAKNRFQMVFRRFVYVFARKEHPLALFLDDLQWLDAATLDLLEHLVTHPEVRYLLLIGAYRDNEVTRSHPLLRMLDTVRNTGASVQESRLSPLNREDLGRLIADTFTCERDRADPLARLVHEKTGGNPFFVIQFLSSLTEEGLLRFDRDAARWRWELDRVQARGYTDNVVDLMVGKLNRLPAKTQAALQQLACFGSVAEITMFSTVLGKSNEEVQSDLQDAVRLELVEHSEESYKFVHDRVWEAAYFLIPDRSRAELHLRIGRLLAAHTPREKREEVIFEIVNQLNRGAVLITSQDEREQLAEFNLEAGNRAKASTAYGSALNYLIAGEALLTQDSWKRRRDLRFQLGLHRAECEFLTGELTAAAERLTMLSARAADLVEQSTVTCLQLDLYTILEVDRAVAVCLDYLSKLGIEWSPDPTDEEARREYQRIWSQLGKRAIEDLIELPLMSDPIALASVDVLIRAAPSAYLTNQTLWSLIICFMVNLSLEHGNCDGSCNAYVNLGKLAGSRFGNYKDGYRFGRLGYELVEKRNFRRYQVRTYMTFGSYIIPWTRHVRAGRDLIRRAFHEANEVGDLTYAGYSCTHLIANYLAAGDHLLEVQREAENLLKFVQRVRFGLISDQLAAQLGLIRSLRGLTQKFGSFDAEGFEETQFELHLSGDGLPISEWWYWIRILQARFFAGDNPRAVAAAVRLERMAWKPPSFFKLVEYHFYSALARAASCDAAFPSRRHEHFEALTAHFRQLELWMENCPENFENRVALVAAEIARIEGRELDAEHLYEKAIRSAHANGFVNNEALANELAARFYASRGFEKIAKMYLREARVCYLRWGASGKVRQLDQLHPYLTEEMSARGPTSTIVASLEHLDLETIIKVSQAVSGEIVSEKLIDTLMRTAIEHAGAERGLLILTRGSEQRVEAEATTSGDAVGVNVRETPLAEAALPGSIVDYVIKTRESVILADATIQNQFSADPYIGQQRARSILCLPLIKQTTLIGVIYLENNLMAGVFTPTRVAVLVLLASQAAVSLENTRLYTDLEEREAKIRRLVDANIMGIFIWNLEGDIIEANDAFLEMVGYSREDVRSGRVRWPDLTPPKWHDRDRRAVTALMTTGTEQPTEKEYFRKDGSLAPVLVGAAAFGGRGDEGVAFVVDLSERKRAEARVLESERRYREVQLALEHANRAATMGQLSASIAHEVNQPIAAAVTNAHTALRWLGAQPPNLDKIHQALDRILDNSKRAAEVISGIRALIKKEPPRRERFEINECILEVIALTGGEVTRNGISVRTQLADDLPFVQGDRVQLQQVVLNLIVNAAEAMTAVSEGPRELLISTGESGLEGVLVAVIDTGQGLASANPDRLFEAFYTTKPGGLGMGLPICRSIIEALGGRLWAVANVPRGAIFQFTVPADAEAKVRTSPSDE
jgi:PAS domain S-box-containing protein